MDTESSIDDVFALLTDGTCIQIRPAVPEDWQAVHDFATGLGHESLYRRFVGYPKLPGKLIADAVCSPVPEGMPAPRGSLLALADGRVLGLAEWIRADRSADAEIAVIVADRLQGLGIATLLAEHLLDAARGVGIHRFTATTRPENRAMLEVLSTLGIPVKQELSSGESKLSIDLDLDVAAHEDLI